MKTIKLFSAGALLLFGLGLMNTVSAQCGSSKSASNVKSASYGMSSYGGHEEGKTQDIVDLAASQESLSTLVAAVKAAGLVETLKSDGPFTVFAPTNEAFNALPKGTLATLLKPENKEMLAKILTYHVVAGTVASTDLTDGQQAATVQGDKVKVTFSETGVLINEARVVTADVKAANGIVHIIDRVILPPSN